MMHGRHLLIAVLSLTLAACAAPPTPPPTPTLTHTPIPTPPPTPTLTHTPIPTPPPTLTHTPTPTPTHTPTPIPTPSADRASLDALPVEPPPRPFYYTVVNPEPPRRVPNTTRVFWITDGLTGERREITARLRVQTEHAAVWVEEGIWHDVRELEKAATLFEAQIYPTTRAAFGPEWTPGVDNDPHIYILHATGLGEGVLGYTSSADEFPRALHPFSNEAEMITINADHFPLRSGEGPGVGLESTAYYALLARQFQRLIQWFQDRNEERWVKEGLAELAVQLNELDPGEMERTYLARPDTSLTAWEDKDAAAHRGAAYLFATYFHERCGDAGTRALVAQPLNGTAGFDAALTDLDTGLTFEDIFAEWLVANYLDSEAGADTPSTGFPRLRSGQAGQAPSTGSGQAPCYGYATLDLERLAPAAIYENYPVTVEASVQQFGADYILLRGNKDLRVQFSGASATPLLHLLPHSGHCFWWSNRADESLTTLTRAFDLSSVEQATLTYWTWYDIEPGYDYATVEVSTDGGQRWQMVSTPSGTSVNPHSNNPGWGYTGQSGDPPGWIQEKVDLSPYVGGEVLVRFAYLTDEAVIRAGFMLDDITIPEIGYADDVETGESEWQPAGFVHSDNSVSQRYLALLIGLGQDGITVERLPVEEDGLTKWTVPLGSEGWREAVLVLSGLAPLTTHPALYQLTIEN